MTAPEGSAGDDGVDRVEIQIHASPEKVYDLVADVTNMGRWSPETYRCQWLDGADGPKEGARFKGWNKQGPLRWSTRCEVLVADRGLEFTFRVRDSGATWSYRFNAKDDGTHLVETRRDGDKPLIAKVFGGLPFRKGKLEAGMQATVERIKAAAEAAEAA